MEGISGAFEVTGDNKNEWKMLDLCVESDPSVGNTSVGTRIYISNLG